MRRLLSRLAARRENGSVMILFAGGLAAFCGFVGMSVDIGKLLYTKGDLQVIADAASLAAAQDLPTSTSTATTTANVYAAKYATSTVTLSFSTTTNTDDTITVTAARYVPFIFLKVVGVNGASTSATAKAKGLPGKAVTGYAWANVAPFHRVGRHSNDRSECRGRFLHPARLRGQIVHLPRYRLDERERQPECPGLDREWQQQLQR